MSSHLISNINHKFDSQFTDINALLDKVIEKNSRVFDNVKSETNDQKLVTRDHRNNSLDIRYPSDQNLNSTNHMSAFTTPDRTDISYTAKYAGASPNTTYVDSNTDLLNRGSLQYIAPSHNEHRAGSGILVGSTPHTDYATKTPQKSKYNQQLKSTAEAQNYTASPYENSFDYYLNKSYNTPQKEAAKQSADFLLEGAGLTGQNKTILPIRDRFEPPSKLVEFNLKNLEADLYYAKKYTPIETIKTIERTPDKKNFMVDPVKDEYFTKYATPPRHGQTDPIEQIVVMTSPEKDIPVSEPIVGVYQQVSEEYNDETSYIGEKFLGLRQGKGTYKFLEGYRYEGTWNEDMMNGYGVMWVAETVKWYEGEWRNNTFHGRGIIYNLTPEELEAGKDYSADFNKVANGWVKYEGFFENGMKQGMGTLFLTNGDSFTGNFSQDNIHGRGSYSKAGSSRIAPGLWQNNVLKMSF